MRSGQLYFILHSGIRQKHMGTGPWADGGGMPIGAVCSVRSQGTAVQSWPSSCSFGLSFTAVASPGAAD